MSQAFEQIKHQEETLLCRSYSRYPVAVARAKGSRIWDIDGKEYLDFLSGIAVTGLGHCHDELIAALTEQANKLWHISNLFYQEPQLSLAQRLLSTSHHTKVFFCNSGAEANEAAIKLARRYMRNVRKTDAYEIITLSNCFHGRTFGALAATGRDNLSDGFTPLPSGFLQVSANDIDALAAAIGPKTAAVMLEVVQGEGGVFVLPQEYLAAVQDLCHQRGVLLICDEVQAGLARTGKFWAFQHMGLQPDIITIAKSLANGLPMGAMLATDDVAHGFEIGSHGSTFGGGALVSAVAAKTIEILLRDNLAMRAQKLGEAFFAQFERYRQQGVFDGLSYRGLGLMIGIQLPRDAKPIWKDLLQQGVICSLSHGNTLRLLPPLTIEEPDMMSFLDALKDSLTRLPA